LSFRSNDSGWFLFLVRVAGYKTWQSFGRHVKQGEKGIMILAPVFRKKDDKTTESQTAEKETNLTGFRAVYVWDESQTAGKPLPEIASVTGDPSVYLARLEDFTRKRGLTLTYSDAIAPAQGMAENGKITLLPGSSQLWRTNWRTPSCISGNVAELRTSAFARPSLRLSRLW
jgi:hypothetical protein